LIEEVVRTVAADGGEMLITGGQVIMAGTELEEMSGFLLEETIHEGRRLTGVVPHIHPGGPTDMLTRLKQIQRRGRKASEYRTAILALIMLRY
jgi:hypothetical protein